MPSRAYIKIVGDVRSPHDNEFFFNSNPLNDPGMREMLLYLENKFDFDIEEIDDWQIRNTVYDAQGDRYLPTPHGLRIVKK